MIAFAFSQIGMQSPAAHAGAAHSSCGVDCTISNFFTGAGEFFSRLAGISWLALLLALALYSAWLTLRSRALFNAIRAAYPGVRIRWRDVWGAYMAGYGISQVIPLGSGNIAQLFLIRTSIEESSYPTVAATMLAPMVFDWCMGLAIMLFAFTQGVFPKPPDFSKLPAFDVGFFAGNMRFTLFFLTALGILFLVAFALLSARVKAFWQRVRQGFTILRDWRRWRREMCSWQFAAWVARFGAYWSFLDAFHIGGSVRNALLVLAVQVIAMVFPFTPGGLGVQQALLVTIFSAEGVAGPTVAAYAVGQTIAIAALALALGFAALVSIFRFRNFREVIERGREDQRRAAAGPERPLEPEQASATR